MRSNPNRRRPKEKMRGSTLVAMAWELISYANGGGGRLIHNPNNVWPAATAEWRGAALKWRDHYYKHPEDTSCLEQAWNILANAYEGNWDRAPDPWRREVLRWREHYFEWAGIRVVVSTDGEAQVETRASLIDWLRTRAKDWRRGEGFRGIVRDGERVRATADRFDRIAELLEEKYDNRTCNLCKEPLYLLGRKSLHGSVVHAVCFDLHELREDLKDLGREHDLLS